MSSSELPYSFENPGPDPISAMTKTTNLELALKKGSEFPTSSKANNKSKPPTPPQQEGIVMQILKGQAYFKCRDCNSFYPNQSRYLDHRNRRHAALPYACSEVGEDLSPESPEQNQNPGAGDTTTAPQPSTSKRTYPALIYHHTRSRIRSTVVKPVAATNSVMVERWLASTDDTMDGPVEPTFAGREQRAQKSPVSQNSRQSGSNAQVPIRNYTKESGRFSCPFKQCEIKGRTKSRIDGHVCAIHTLEKPYKCPGCHWNFHSKDAYLKHCVKSNFPGCIYKV